MEEGPEREKKVWSLCFSHLSAEELHFEETGQYMTPVVSQIDQYRLVWPSSYVFIIRLCCQGVEIQRVWSLHDVLLSLDYASEDNKQIIDLLLQCFHQPTYIRNDDVSSLILGRCVCVCVSVTVSIFPVSSHCCGFVCVPSA